MDDTYCGTRHRAASISRTAISLLFAALLAALIIFAAKPAQAQVVDPVTLTVDQTEIGFGAVMVDGSVATREITVTNTGDTPIIIGGATFTTAAGEVLDFSTDIDPVNGLTVESGGANTFTVSFDPSVEGTRDATLTLLEQLGDGTIGGTIGLVDETGQTVTGIDLSGSGSTTDPLAQPGAQGCDIVGTNNGETLTGTPASETICGLGGADKINGRGGNDVLKGGSGNDRITDKSGKDKLIGGGGRDTLNAKDRRPGDLLKGGGGKDRAIKDGRDKARSI